MIKETPPRLFEAIKITGCTLMPCTAVSLHNVATLEVRHGVLKPLRLEVMVKFEVRAKALPPKLQL